MSHFDYYKSRIDYVTKKINEEINFYSLSEYHAIDPLSSYVLYLKARIGKDKQEYTTMIHTDNQGNKHEMKKMDTDEYASYINIIMFKKPWNKLRKYHKIMKIKKFIDDLKYDNKIKSEIILKNKQYITEEIISGLDSKKFGKNKGEIIYDQDKMEITSISCLDYNKKKKIYEIDWD
ncbi:hypothetical protein QLL95_gp0901 [Cotonvirus japonicus]|uniref:Uncharacterized protein n=1 Tax=Cotonvirus japonicus TaxID=2811091 RepID=A0ABM7NSS8_9VIRU|nr:hypothetical protein QLL95_gp0901 [Cotonvirus japonicus]BCS83222.1 hypothetical protein [Cotonvirus japonicus]